MHRVHSFRQLIILVPLSVSVSHCLDTEVPEERVPSGEVVGVTVGPANSRVREGRSLQLTLNRVFSGGTLEDVTSEGTWSTSNEAVATVDEAGLLTAVAVGTSTIQATLDSLSDRTFVFVTPGLIEVQTTPFAPSLTLGVDRQFVATGIFSDYSVRDLAGQVVWAFEDEEDVTAIVDADGLATGVRTGTTTLAASVDGLFVSSEVTVVDEDVSNLVVAPSVLSFAPNVSGAQLVATGVFGSFEQDLTSQVLWTSSDPAVASVSSDGAVTAGQVGEATITASFMGITADAAVTVAEVTGFAVDPASASVPVGWTVQLEALGPVDGGAQVDLTSAASWSVVDDGTQEDDRVSVDAQGLVVGESVGSEVVRAEIVFGDSDLNADVMVTVTDASLQNVRVSPRTSTVAVGGTAQFTLTGIFTDSSTRTLTAEATWRSSEREVAGISNVEGSRGQAAALGEGTTTIEVRFVREGETFQDSASLTVMP